MNLDMDEILRIDEMCEILNIGKNTAYKLLNTKEIKAFQIGRMWKIPKSSIQEYILRKSDLQTHSFNR